MESNQLKVGDSAEVIVITDNSHYPSLYNGGDCGIITQYLWGCIAFIGIQSNNVHGWHVHKGAYKKIGKLTVTKVK